MDAKVIILLVFILFGMIVAYMVANGMVDLTSIFSRVTKSQAQESLGGVKLEVVSPVAGVYYQATKNTGDAVYHITLGGSDHTNAILKITGKNLDGKTLTVSVASPNWYIVKANSIDWTSVPSKAKTVQATLSADSDYYETDADIHIWRDNSEPFNMPEFVELIFAVGETAKAEVTIVAEPSE